MKLSKKQKRLGALGVAALLVTGAVGTGAVTTLTTALTGNRFSADVPALDENGKPLVPVTGAKIEVSGAPLVYKFDVTKYNDTVQGTWTVINRGDIAAPYNGTLVTAGDVSASLAEQLTVQYGKVSRNGALVSWEDAGTLAKPLTYAEAMGSAQLSLAAGASQSIPVRVILPDPTKLKGTKGETLTVNGTFKVTYTDTSTPES